jgi:hypothetical protein
MRAFGCWIKKLEISILQQTTHHLFNTLEAFFHHFLNLRTIWGFKRVLEWKLDVVAELGIKLLS